MSSIVHQAARSLFPTWTPPTEARRNPRRRRPSRLGAALVVSASALSVSGCVVMREHPTPDTAAAENTDFIVLDGDAAGVPQITMHELDGLEQHEAVQWLAPASVPLGHCRPTSPGLVRVAVTSQGDDTRIRVVGPTVLDATTLECVMSALSLVDVELLEPGRLTPPDDATRQLSPSDAAPVVSSQFTISW